MTINREALAASLSSLVEDATSAQARFSELCRAFKLGHDAGLRLTLADDAALNPLLEALYETPENLGAFLRLVNSKRADRGYIQLHATHLEVEQSESRREYMAEKMRIKRDREARLVDAWNSMLPVTKQLRGRARSEFQRVHAKRWQDAKAERKANLENAEGRLLRREEIQKMEEAFWEDVEEEIAALEQFAREEMRRAVSDRSPHGFDFKLLSKR